MSVVYRIRDWDSHFENNQTRPIKQLSRVLVPNKLDGDGFTELITGHENGDRHYAAWMLMLLVASKCKPRGTLLRDTRKAHDSASLSRMTRVSANIFDEAIPRLVAIEWLETIPLADIELTNGTHPDASAPHPDEFVFARTRAPTEPNLTEKNLTELNTGGGLGAGKGGGSFRALDDIRREHIPHTHIMDALHQRLLKEAPGHVPEGDEGLLLILAASERAIAIGQKPAALFASIVREGRWGLCDDKQRASAKQRLAFYRERQAEVKVLPMKGPQ